MNIAINAPCITGLWACLPVCCVLVLWSAGCDEYCHQCPMHHRSVSVSLPVSCVLVLWSAGGERSGKDHHFQNAHWGHSANIRWSLSQWIQVSLENVSLCVGMCVWGSVLVCMWVCVGVCVCLYMCVVVVSVLRCVCVCVSACLSVVVYVCVSSVSILFAHHSHACWSVCVYLCCGSVLVCVCMCWCESLCVCVCLCMVIHVCVYVHVCHCVSVCISLPTTQHWQHPRCTPPPCLQTSAAGEHCYPFQLLPGSWPPSDSLFSLSSCCVEKWIPFVLLVCWGRLFSVNV